LAPKAASRFHLAAPEENGFGGRRVLPGRVDEAGVDQAGHVRLGGEGDVVGLLAALDGAALVAGGAEGGLEADGLALRRLVEVRDDLVVDDLRGRVRDQRHRGGRVLRAGSTTLAVDRVRSAAAADRGHGGDDERRRHEGLREFVHQSHRHGGDVLPQSSSGMVTSTRGLRCRRV
jgi:hypothetical protein